MNRDTFNTHFPATGTAGGPRDGGCAQPSCENCEELTARVAVLEEERKILVRERDEAVSRVDRYRALTTDLAIQRNEAWEALREIARVALAKMEDAK